MTLVYITCSDPGPETVTDEANRVNQNRWLLYTVYEETRQRRGNKRRELRENTQGLNFLHCKQTQEDQPDPLIRAETWYVSQVWKAWWKWRNLGKWHTNLHALKHVPVWLFSSMPFSSFPLFALPLLSVHPFFKIMFIMFLKPHGSPHFIFSETILPLYLIQQRCHQVQMIKAQVELSLKCK